MDFEFDEGQLDLQAGAAEVLAKACSSTYLRSVVDDDHDPDDLWRSLCSLDWPGLALAEELGGLGASTVELAIVLEQLGYVADPTPFLATTTQFVPVVVACGNAAQQARFLEQVSAGAAATLALAGADGRWDVSSPPVRAQAVEAGWQLDGSARYVLDGDRAAWIAIVAQAEDGPQVFVVPGSAVRAERRPSLDKAHHLTDVHLDSVVVDADCRLAHTSVERLGRALQEAVTGLALQMVGACQRALDLVVEYVRGREQFGVPIGSFQAVKHKAVDMHVAVERARALGYFAALAIAEDDPRRELAAAMAKAAAGDAQDIVFRHSIQLFGGLGFTWENDVHLYLRRAKAGELLLGGASDHRLHVARLVLDGTRTPTEV